jgi:flavin reductase (DIM6/NTAB) family NADH-FMN oxidoreductase RutF
MPTAVAFTPSDLRSALRTSAAGTTVVTTAGPYAFHAQAFTPVSFSPPVVLGRVPAPGARAVERNGAFAVNLLRPDRRWRADTSLRGATGSPLLLEAERVLDCELTLTFDAGGEVIVVGEVCGLHSGDAGAFLLAA